MLYSIIPPVLVVVSLAGIIIFLMKKAPAVARLEDTAKIIPEGERQEEELKARYAALKRENRKSFGEKIATTLRGVVPFLVNLFSFGKSALRKINDNAKAKLESNMISKKQNDLKEDRDNFFRRRKDNQIAITDEEKYSPEVLSAENLEEENEMVEEAEKENKPEKKDLFEKILIDRIASNPKDIEAYERLGEYYLEIENWEYAKECFKQVLKLNPKNSGIRSKMRKLERILSKK